MTSQAKGLWFIEKNLNPGSLNLGPNQYFNDQYHSQNKLFHYKNHNFGSHANNNID